MGDIVHGRRIPLAEVDLSWLVGTAITTFRFHPPFFWVISFSSGGSISTDSDWRILSADCMVVSSVDHAQSFGLPEPLDSGALASSATRMATVSAVYVADSAPDLELSLDSGLRFQVLAVSRGYECWQVADPSGVVVVVDGDRNATQFERPKSEL